MAECTTSTSGSGLASGVSQCASQRRTSADLFERDHGRRVAVAQRRVGQQIDELAAHQLPGLCRAQELVHVLHQEDAVQGLDRIAQLDVVVLCAERLAQQRAQRREQLSGRLFGVSQPSAFLAEGLCRPRLPGAASAPHCDVSQADIRRHWEDGGERRIVGQRQQVELDVLERMDELVTPRAHPALGVGVGTLGDE